MKAIVAPFYGPPESLQLVALPKPEPKADELLVRIQAATVSAADMRLRSGIFPRGFGFLAKLALGLRGPRQPVLGTDLAGEVEAVGSDVKDFSPGDSVIAFFGAKLGCHAEYRAVSTKSAICHKPRNLTWEQAAALPFGATTALYFLQDKAKLRQGERLLVVGASGAVGTAAVQIAKHMGASVSAVTSTPNVALVRSLGADDVIDYKQTDWSALNRQWDVILDTTGTVDQAKTRRSLPSGGRLALVAADLWQMLSGPFASDVKVLTGTAPERAEDLRYLASLAAEGVLTPVVSVTFPLEEASKAHALAESGRKVGNVVLSMA
ncbi:MAG: NAD(P)-dependent alcohol dehydrogenase [Beijerinckiaceae bacterium]